jgi:hypothetical protein
MGTILVRGTIDQLARESGVHPDVVRRLVALGLVSDRPPLEIDAAARLARAVRLRRDLGLNYAGAVLACDLLARIDALEARLRRADAHILPSEVTTTWTPTS